MKKERNRNKWSRSVPRWYTFLYFQQEVHRWMEFQASTIYNSKVYPLLFVEYPSLS